VRILTPRATYRRVPPFSLKWMLNGKNRTLRLDQYDELNDESWGSLDFKRKVEKAVKKTDKQTGKQKKSN